MNTMGMPQSEPPNTWEGHPLHDKIKDAGGGLYYAIYENDEPLIMRIWVWHWHTPTEGAHRWTMAGVGNHTVVQEDPLTLSPSLACYDGCPNHGFLVDGVWRPC